MTSTYEFLGEQQPESMTVRERMDREPRWVGWKTEQRDGTPTKVPINPTTGDYARSNDPTTWGTLADAEDAAARFALDGIGFMLGGGWAGIDIDGPAEWKASLPKNDVEAHARRVQVYEKEIGNAPVGEWVARIGGYSEFSPNNGIKVIVVGFSFEKENDDHKNGTGLEFYAGTRFFTVTGALLLDSPKVNLDAFRALAACRPSRRGAGAPTPSRSGTNGTTSYGAAALRETVAELRSTRQGDRNNQLNIAAFTLGQLVEGGELDELEARHELTSAALVCGLGTDEIRRTLDRALEDGKREPRTAPPRTTTPRTTPSRTEGAQVIVPTPTPLEPAWDVPVPFPADNIEGAPSFPSHVLPQAARNVIRAVSSFVEVDEGLVAQNVLGIGSFPIARKVVVIEGAWWEETNLWTVGAADSGERKSATLRVIVKPTREVERERRAEEREQIANEGAALEMLEQQYAAQIKAAAKETSEPDRTAAEIELRETARRLDEMRRGERTKPASSWMT